MRPRGEAFQITAAFTHSLQSFSWPILPEFSQCHKHAPPPPPPPGEGLILGYLLKCFIGVLPVFVALNHFARAFRGLNNITACMHASMHLSIHPSIHPSCCQFLEAWVLNMIYGLPKNVIILTATNQHTMHVHALQRVTTFENGSRCSGNYL